MRASGSWSWTVSRSSCPTGASGTRRTWASTLVELLAYVGDQLSYAQDAVATEAYLGTARRRASVRRHARLVDYFMHDGANARAWLVFETQADRGNVAAPAVPAGTPVVAGGHRRATAGWSCSRRCTRS